jgi:ferric-dicitrate binding protein FerR (iron transport regulator)
MKYKKAAVTDFISDENFQNWIIQPNEEINEFWNNWLEANPEMRPVVNNARQVLLNIKFKEDTPNSEQIQNALKKNLLKIDLLENQQKAKIKVFSINRIKRFAAVAAIFIGLAIIGIIYYSHWKNEETTISTHYGEVKTIMLPDQTEITLNAHSSVRFLKHWDNDAIREVQLQGEAFFKVKHLNKNEKEIKKSERFIVSTNDLTVEVLGTTFNVKSRHSQTSVVLKTGKIQVRFRDEKQNEITMRPGEMITYRASDNQLKKSVTDPIAQTSWVDKKLVLDNAPISTIIQYIEDNYGYKVIMEDSAIGNKKMEGTLLLDNLKDVLFVLSTSLDIKIEQHDSTLIFSKIKRMH